MAPVPHHGSWSDSDEEEHPSGVETNVLLGIPDGQIENQGDLIDAAVSRIGGLPALLPTKEPSFMSSSCNSCLKPMELLVQLWCPFENSPMDRTLYIWGCARTGCQGKKGSVRAWRSLRYNEKYAAKLQRKNRKALDLRKDQYLPNTEAPPQQRASTVLQSNPFTMTVDVGNPFSVAARPIGTSMLSKGPISGTLARGDPVGAPSCDPEENGRNNNHNGYGDEEDENDSDTDSSESSLITALASTALSESTWKSAPSYPPLYLSTLTEYLPPQGIPKLPKGLKVEGLREDVTWTKEKYENSLELDQIFERFTKRVAVEAKQCIRYELNGIPLPFTSDEVSNLLWPKPASITLPTAKSEVVRPSWRVYDATKTPRCPSCNASRVFECQLMPNLINILRPTLEEEIGKEVEKMTYEERRKQIERSLKKSEANKDEKCGMEWGTCFIFSCEKDCCLEDGKEAKEAWREEVVYIQWDV